MGPCSQYNDHFMAGPLTTPCTDKQPPAQWNTAAV